MREAKGEASAQLIDHLKKSEMAKEAERLLDDTGWLPEPLRLAGVAPWPDVSGAAGALPEFLADDEEEGGRGRRERAAHRRGRITHRCGAAEAAPQSIRHASPLCSHAG